MGGQAAEQIIAGVVLSERLAVTMYGAMHRAQFSGQRNLRGLVVQPKLLAETAFRLALTDARTISTVTALAHDCIVPTFAVESGGADVVVVTRGVGRYVTVQDLVAAAKATRKQGKLDTEVAGTIAKCVVEALAAAHAAKVVHGAVHPSSVLLDEDGGVRLGDFIVGRALTTAVAQGADSSLWRGLAGYIAPELAVGEDPTPAADVFAVGALLFTMLSGEVPPGPVRTTPAVERLVARALDTDVGRRYRNAQDLLQNMVEAFEDDRWELADRGEVIKAAGLSKTDTNIDDATEDLLASLGNSAVSVTPMRPSMDIRAEAVARRQTRQPSTGTGRLDALLSDLEDGGLTYVDALPGADRDPISEIIQLDPRRPEAIVQKGRVPSLDDVDDDPVVPPAPRKPTARAASLRPNTTDENAAMDALAGLDEPVRRVSTAADQATAAAERLESAARRAEAAAARAVPRPNVELPAFDDQPPPSIKSRSSRVIGLLSLVVVAGGGYAFYHTYTKQTEERAANDKKHEADVARAAEQTRLAQASQADKGTIKLSVTPPEASLWIKLGRTNGDALFPLNPKFMHRIRIELDGYQGIDTEILPATWTGQDPYNRKTTVNVVLKAAAKDRKTGKSLAVPLPARPPNLAVQPAPGTGENGFVRLESTPPGAEVWILTGFGNTAQPFPIVAGRNYELRALMEGYKPGYAQVSSEEWRVGTDTNVPIDIAKKKAQLDKSIELVADPDYVPPKHSKKGS